MGELSERESLAMVMHALYCESPRDHVRPSADDLRHADAALAWVAAHQPARAVPCPECGGDGATYVQARVGQAATPLVCSACGGDGTAAAGVVPSAEEVARYEVAVRQGMSLSTALDALYASQPTVAEVREQTLREAADAYTDFDGDRGTSPVVRRWLHDRAARTETKGGE